MIVPASLLIVTLLMITSLVSLLTKVATKGPVPWAFSRRSVRAPLGKTPGAAGWQTSIVGSLAKKEPAAARVV